MVTGLDHHVGDRASPWLGRGAGDRVDDVLAVDDLAEDGVLPVQQ